MQLLIVFNYQRRCSPAGGRCGVGHTWRLPRRSSASVSPCAILGLVTSLKVPPPQCWCHGVSPQGFPIPQSRFPAAQQPRHQTPTSACCVSHNPTQLLSRGPRSFPAFNAYFSIMSRIGTIRR